MIIIVLLFVYLGTTLLIAVRPELKVLQVIAVTSGIVAVYKMVEDFIRLIRPSKKTVPIIPIETLEQVIKKARNPQGYVYLIQSSTGHYKIGHTANPLKRLRTFEAKLPFEIEYVHLIATTNRFALEKELHTKFADRRVRGEWFALTSADIAYIKLLK